jgi:hypothetical protein
MMVVGRKSLVKRLATFGPRPSSTRTLLGRPGNQTTKVKGAFSRLSGRIWDAAREIGEETIRYSFEATYDFGDVSFSHGRASVEGLFVGFARQKGEMLVIEGSTAYRFKDRFTDPGDLRQSLAEGLPVQLSDIGGIAYDVTGFWTSDFTAEVLIDDSLSIYSGE